jgi:2-oxoisovalerate dehydrogenase E1 component
MISVWKLPTIVLVTDNGVAISTLPEEGRGIRDFEAYAKGVRPRALLLRRPRLLGLLRDHAARATVRAGAARGVLLHVHSLPRFNGHSSAADVTFDLSPGRPAHHVRRGAGQARRRCATT